MGFKGDHLAYPETHTRHIPGCVIKHKTYERKTFDETGKKKSDKAGKFTAHNCSYRYNGYQELSKNPKKKIYNIDFTSAKNATRLPYIYLEKKTGTGKWLTWDDVLNPVTDKKAWFIGEGGKYAANFTKAYIPYVHNYHHIMPETAIKKCLDNTEKLYLQIAEYNLNDKDNLIILPSLEAYSHAILLPSHYTNHPDYNTGAKKALEKLANIIDRLIDGHKIIKEDRYKKLKEQLVKWQKEQFEIIKKEGKKEAKNIDPKQDLDDIGRHKDPEKSNSVNLVSAADAKIRT